MRGIYRVIVQSKRLKYDFVIRRNITIIRGDSATGKSTLVNMIRDFPNTNGGIIELNCDKKCVVLEGQDWRHRLLNIKDSIVFIDEGNDFIKTREFASMIQNTDNYYVMITRWDLRQLPYSVSEIYEIRNSGKYKGTKQIYNELFHLYKSYGVIENEIEPSMVITEDSNAGYQFFSHLCDKQGMKCETANGKSNICKYISKGKNNIVLIVADGAAFGSEMNEVINKMKYSKNYVLYLPESFEWLILKSGAISGNNIHNILENPGDYIESKEYFSWERYFTWFLTYVTKNTESAYTKERLSFYYKRGDVTNKILKVMEKIKFI